MREYGKTPGVGLKPLMLMFIPDKVKYTKLQFYWHVVLPRFLSENILDVKKNIYICAWGGGRDYFTVDIGRLRAECSITKAFEVQEGK